MLCPNVFCFIKKVVLHKKYISLFELAFLSFFFFIFFPAFQFNVFADESLSYVHQDHLGSNTLVSDKAGNEISRQTYYPYGTTRGSLNNLPTERAYTDQVFDQDQTGLYYYNARYYNPTLGLFNQADNLGVKINRYVYAANNPILYNDPSGNLEEAFNVGSPSEVGGIQFVSRVNDSSAGRQVNILSYFVPQGGGPAISMSNNIEVFQYRPCGGNCFIYQKSTDPNYYERFCIEGDVIVHYEDTTWSNENGNVRCSTGEYSCLSFRRGMEKNQEFKWDNPPSAGMPWVPLNLRVGQTYSAAGTIVGQIKSDGSCQNFCEAPNTGSTWHTIRLDYQGTIVFPNSNVCDDGIALRNTSGPGKGESFYYCKGYGWVAFTREQGDQLNYALTPLGGTLPKKPVKTQPPKRPAPKLKLKQPIVIPEFPWGDSNLPYPI